MKSSRDHNIEQERKDCISSILIVSAVKNLYITRIMLLLHGVFQFVESIHDQSLEDSFWL